ncbi:phosphoglycerate mutase [Saccharomycopsis crataegensis]|uniref:Phosphoglycerate mutase n=1 Tax=Saccharomycopsis crataegensis TaxID=43959 RepID=A0AAV5QQS0_9ASCO|nr:phosphoglycerate mutase [Saccharomycopsis crataegensis]
MTQLDPSLFLASTDSLNNTDPAILRLFLVRHGQTNANKNNILQGHLNTSLNLQGHSQAQLCGSRFQQVKVDKVWSSDLRRCLQTLWGIVVGGDVKVDETTQNNEFAVEQLVEKLEAAAMENNGKFEADKDPETGEIAGDYGSLDEDISRVKGDGSDSGSRTPISISNKFRERSMGPIEGRHIDDALKYAVANGKNSYRDFGESKHDFCDRLFGEVEQNVVDIVANDDSTKNCLLITHGGSIRALINHFANDLQYNMNPKLIPTDDVVKIVYNTSITVIDVFKKDVKDGKLGLKSGIIQVVGDTKHLGSQVEVKDQRIR